MSIKLFRRQTKTRKPGCTCPAVPQLSMTGQNRASKPLRLKGVQLICWENWHGQIISFFALTEKQHPRLRIEMMATQAAGGRPKHGATTGSEVVAAIEQKHFSSL